MTHELFREQLPLYVLGVLEGDELTEFNSYLEENRDICNSELIEFQEVANHLAYSAPQINPSQELYDNLMEKIGYEKVEEPRAEIPIEPVRNEVIQQKQIASEPSVSGSKKNERGISSWLPWVGLAIASVLLILMVVRLKQANRQIQTVNFQNSEIRNQGQEYKRTIAELRAHVEGLAVQTEQQSGAHQREADQLRIQIEKIMTELSGIRGNNAQLIAEKAGLEAHLERSRDEQERHALQVAVLQQKVEVQNRSLELLTDPSIKIFEMKPIAEDGHGLGKVYWRPDKEVGGIAVSNLVPVIQGKDKCLEVWAICGPNPPVPSGIFWTDKAGRGYVEIKPETPLGCLGKFAITIEPEGGVSTPTGTMVLLSQ